MTCLSRKPALGNSWSALRRQEWAIGMPSSVRARLNSNPCLLSSVPSYRQRKTGYARRHCAPVGGRAHRPRDACRPPASPRKDHARYRFPTLGTVEYSGAKVDQGFEAAAGFVDLNTPARKDGHATLDHDIQASPRCRCRPGGSRGGRYGRRRRRDGQAGCNARADAIHSLVLSIVLLAGVIFGIGVEAKRKRELEPWRARIRLIGTLLSGRRFYSWCEAGRTSIGPCLKPQDGKSHNKERTASDRQLCYCLVGFSALADPLGPRQRRRGKQRRRGQQ